MEQTIPPDLVKISLPITDVFSWDAVAIHACELPRRLAHSMSLFRGFGTNNREGNRCRDAVFCRSKICSQRIINGRTTVLCQLYAVLCHLSNIPTDLMPSTVKKVSVQIGTRSTRRRLHLRLHLPVSRRKNEFGFPCRRIVRFVMDVRLRFEASCTKIPRYARFDTESQKRTVVPSLCIQFSSSHGKPGAPLEPAAVKRPLGR